AASRAWARPAARRRAAAPAAPPTVHSRTWKWRRRSSRAGERAGPRRCRLPGGARTLAEATNVCCRVEVDDARNAVVAFDRQLVDAAAQHRVPDRPHLQNPKDRILLGDRDHDEGRLGGSPVAGREDGIDETADPLNVVIGFGDAPELLQRHRP